MQTPKTLITKSKPGRACRNLWEECKGLEWEHIPVSYLRQLWAALAVWVLPSPKAPPCIPRGDTWKFTQVTWALFKPPDIPCSFHHQTVVSPRNPDYLWLSWLHKHRAHGKAITGLVEPQWDPLCPPGWKSFDSWSQGGLLRPKLTTECAALSVTSQQILFISLCSFLNNGAQAAKNPAVGIALNTQVCRVKPV